MVSNRELRIADKLRTQSHLYRSVRTVSLPDRLHWLKRLRHSKVRFLFSGGGYCESKVPRRSVAPMVSLAGDDDVRKGKATALDGAIVAVNSAQSQDHVQELRVCHDICARNKVAENNRRPFPKALFPPPPEKVEGDDDEESEEAKKRRLKDLKKSVRQELKRGLAGAKTDEVEWGNYDDEVSEDEEDEDEEEEVSQCYRRHSPFLPHRLSSPPPSFPLPNVTITILIIEIYHFQSKGYFVIRWHIIRLDSRNCLLFTYPLLMVT